MTRRMSNDLALDFTRQALAAVAHAHERKIIHCDVKPENFIIFPDNRLRLADFGFSKIALRSVKKASARVPSVICRRSRPWAARCSSPMSSHSGLCCTSCSVASCRNGPTSGRPRVTRGFAASSGPRCWPGCAKRWNQATRSLQECGHDGAGLQQDPPETGEACPLSRARRRSREAR